MTPQSQSADSAPGHSGRLGRSRRARPQSEPQSVLRADHGSWTVDRVVRAMATACAQENREVPAAHAVVVGPEIVWFHLRTPDERPPAGWTADQDGRIWRARLRLLQSADIAQSLREPYPQLVSLGSAGKGFVLLNLNQAGGIIGLEGDTPQARVLAQDWARELTTSPWSRGLQVVRIGFKSGSTDPVGAVEVKTLADAEEALAEAGGGVLLFDGLPGGRDGERIRKLADDPERHWSVVVVGRVEDPRWRFTVDSAGVVDTGLLDEPVAHLQADPAEQLPAWIAPGGRRHWLLSTPRRMIGAILAVAFVLALADHFATLATAPSSAASARPSAIPSATKAASKGVPAGGTGLVVSLGSGLCLDSDSNPARTLNGKAEGGHAFAIACNGHQYQQWTEGRLLSQDSPRSGDIYRLVDLQSGFCLDSDAAGDLYTLPCLSPDQYQMWQRVIPQAAPAVAGPAAGDARIVYRDVATNRCMSVDPAQQPTLLTLPCPTTNSWPKTMLFYRPS